MNAMFLYLNSHCDINEKKSNIIGCNKKINLDNKVYYIHQIIMSDGTIYKINIKKKEDNAEELISIDSIEGIDKKSNTSIKMKVNASSKSGELTYSIDNGLTYQTENEFIINEDNNHSYDTLIFVQDLSLVLAIISLVYTVIEFKPRALIRDI